MKTTIVKLLVKRKIVLRVNNKKKKSLHNSVHNVFGSISSHQMILSIYIKTCNNASQLEIIQSS